MKQAHLIFDIGTGNSKIGVVTPEGEILAAVTRDSAYYFDADFKNATYFKPEEWLETFDAMIREAMVKAGDVEIISLTSSSQRQGIVLISKEGEVLVGYPNSDSRGAEFLATMDWDTVRKINGVGPNDLYSCVKFFGTMKRQPQIAEKTRYYTSISDWIGYWATGKVVWERSQAMMAAVYDIKKGIWSQECCDAIGVEIEKLPPIAEGGTVLGPVKPELIQKYGFAESAVFIIGAADTQIALTGSRAEPDEMTIVSGTTTPVAKIKREIMDTPAWFSPHAITGEYVLEVNVAFTGINLQRFKNLLLKDFSYEDLIAATGKRKVPRCMAMFSMCPHLGDEPVFSGGFLMQNPMEHDLEEAEFFHALTLDIAMGTTLCIERINDLEPYDRSYVVGCGGGLRSPLLCQAIADLSGYQLRLYEDFEQATMMGCLYLCNEALQLPHKERVLYKEYEPRKNPELLAYYERWKKLRECLRGMNGV